MYTPWVRYTIWYTSLHNFLGYFCTTGRSGIIGVGTRIHVTRIAATPQEYGPVCVTHHKTHFENCMVLVFKRNWLGCWMGGRNILRSTSFHFGGSELIGFQCMDRNGLGFVWWSKKTSCRTWIEIKLVFVSGGIEI